MELMFAYLHIKDATVSFSSNIHILIFGQFSFGLGCVELIHSIYATILGF